MENDERHIRLLLVDDEDDFRDAARQALSRQGFDVTEANSGQRALELLADYRPEVVVLDLKMDGLDGISTLDRIRSFDKALPVMILTGHGRYEDALAGLRLGVVDFVQKPVDLKDLGNRIRKLVALGSEAQLKEKTIGDLMVPVSLYTRLYSDQTVREAVNELLKIHSLTDNNADRGRRTLLVFDRKEQFLGLIRAEDIVRVIIPTWLDSPYASYFTGMFLAQAKLVGVFTLESVIRTTPSIDIDRPLMEAAHLIVSRHLSHLPVKKKGEMVGILRPEDLYREVANPFPEVPEQ
jgi:DNA-binding response OmpR family regulator